MGFLLTEDQDLIRKTAKAFVQERLPIGQFRKLRDEKVSDGFVRDAWKDLAASGLVGVAIPEAYGGGGLGMAELGLVLEECGRTLAMTPFLSTVLLSANAIVLGGSEAQKTELLPGIANGESFAAFAHEEATRFAPYAIATTATASANVFRLKGQKSYVLDAGVANHFVVVARSSGHSGERAGLSLFVVPAKAAGVTVTPLSALDSRKVGRVAFDVEVPASALLGKAGEGADILDRVLNLATAGLCAEMLGSVQEAYDTTLAYLKVRKQFGVPIGSFQALKHRAANMFCEVELSKSIVMEALRALDANRADAPLVVSAAKARLNDTYLLVSAEAVQMHGGIGVTDELDIGFFYKRARTCDMTLGNSAYHRDRFAILSGY